LNSSLFIRQSTENTLKNSHVIISNPNGKSRFDYSALGLQIKNQSKGI